MQWTPRPYQLETVRHLLGRREANAFLEPGLGKTSCTLAAVKVLQTQAKCRAALVVAPIRVAYRVWPTEVAKWADFNDLRVSLIHGPKKAAALAAPADIYVTTYETLAWLAKQPGPFPWDLVVFDESSKLKDSSTQRFKAALHLRERAKACWNLTGTPRPNNAKELYAPQRVQDLGRALGRSLTAFRRKYCFGVTKYAPGGRTFTDWQLREGADAEIMEAIRPSTVTLRAKDHLDLPPLMHNKIMVTLPAEARAAYSDLAEHFIADIDAGRVTAANAAVLSGKLRQVASGCCYDSDRNAVQLHEAKLDALEDLVEEMGGEPLLVLVAFEHEVRRIRERLGKDIPYLGGGMSASESSRVIDAWNRNEVPVLLGHPASMGHGLNLQDGGAHVLCWFGLTWSGEQHEQAIARLYRQGQRHATVAHYILAADTVDETVYQVLAMKAAGQNALLDALKSAVASS